MRRGLIMLTLIIITLLSVNNVNALSFKEVGESYTNGGLTIGSPVVIYDVPTNAEYLPLNLIISGTHIGMLHVQSKGVIEINLPDGNMIIPGELYSIESGNGISYYNFYLFSPVFSKTGRIIIRVPANDFTTAVSELPMYISNYIMHNNPVLVKTGVNTFFFGYDSKHGVMIVIPVNKAGFTLVRINMVNLNHMVSEVSASDEVKAPTSGKGHYEVQVSIGSVKLVSDNFYPVFDGKEFIGLKHGGEVIRVGTTARFYVAPNYKLTVNKEDSLNCGVVEVTPLRNKIIFKFVTQGGVPYFLVGSNGKIELKINAVGVGSGGDNNSGGNSNNHESDYYVTGYYDFTRYFRYVYVLYYPVIKGNDAGLLKSLTPFLNYNVEIVACNPMKYDVEVSKVDFVYIKQGGVSVTSNAPVTLGASCTQKLYIGVSAKFNAIYFDRNDYNQFNQLISMRYRKLYSDYMRYKNTRDFNERKSLYPIVYNEYYEYLFLKYVSNGYHIIILVHARVNGKNVVYYLPLYQPLVNYYRYFNQ